MIPFADCINHHNVDSTYEMIHHQFHKYVSQPDHPSRGLQCYYTKSKLEMDFTDFLPDYSADSEDVDQEKEEE